MIGSCDRYNKIHFCKYIKQRWREKYRLFKCNSYFFRKLLTYKATSFTKHKTLQRLLNAYIEFINLVYYDVVEKLNLLSNFKIPGNEIHTNVP